MTYKYPKGWIEERSNIGDLPITQESMASQSSVVSTADKTIKVKIAMYVGGGMGGACDPDGPVLDWFGYEKSQNLPGFSYVEYIYRDKYANNQWAVRQGIGDGRGKDVAAIKAGNSYCDVMNATSSPLAKFTSVGYSPMLVTNITPYGSDGLVYFGTLAEAKNYLASDNAKHIKAIFLSIK